MAEQTRKISKAHRVLGEINVPGDKSISHRYAMLGALAEGATEIDNFASSADCQSTLGCIEVLGIPVERRGNFVRIEGRGLHGLSVPKLPLDAGNSGSTMRMLSGILAGQPFTSTLVGDASLSRRPMKRIMEPLRRMGAQITSSEGGLPPLRIAGGSLVPISYEPPIASAQVKTSILFAGMFAEGRTEVIEPIPTRDHTEIALKQMGAELVCEGKSISIQGPARLHGLRARVPGDISSAAFFLAAALLVPGSSLLIREVGLNPKRAALIDVLAAMGADVRRSGERVINGELSGSLEVRYQELEGGTIPTETVPLVIDELPVLAVLGTRTRHGLTFRGAQELRVKESDRLATVAGNLRRMGAQVEEFPDGLSVAGRQELHWAEIETHGDHRIAMAFAVAGLVADGGVTIRESDCVAVSFPEFFSVLDRVTQ